MSNSQISVSITSTVNVKNSLEHYTVYNIEVTTEFLSWVVSKRYRQFYELHEKLQQKYDLVKGFDFPKKKAIGNLNPKTIETRKSKLESYLKKCIASQLEQDPLLRDFLELQRQEKAPFFKSPQTSNVSESASSNIQSKGNTTANSNSNNQNFSKEPNQKQSTQQETSSLSNVHNINQKHESDEKVDDSKNEPNESNTKLEGSALKEAYTNEPMEIYLKTVRDNIEDEIHAVLVPENYHPMNLQVTRKGHCEYTINFIVTRPGNCQLTVYYTDKRIKIAGPYTIKVISKEIPNTSDKNN